MPTLPSHSRAQAPLPNPGHQHLCVGRAIHNVSYSLIGPRQARRPQTSMLVMGCVLSVRFMMPAMTLLGPSS